MNSILLQFLISLLSAIIVVALYHFFIKNRLKARDDESRMFELESAVRRLVKELPKTSQSINTKSSNNDIVLTKKGKKKEKKKRDNSAMRVYDSNDSSSIVINEAIDKTKEDFEVKETIKEEVEANQEKMNEPTPSETKYTSLTISDGKLVEATIGQTVYYRSWLQKGRIFFEFYCERSRMMKAINNRSAILDPCCIKDESSVLPDQANYVENIRPGELDSDYSIIKKTTIKFIK